MQSVVATLFSQSFSAECFIFVLRLALLCSAGSVGRVGRCCLRLSLPLLLRRRVCCGVVVGAVGGAGI